MAKNYQIILILDVKIACVTRALMGFHFKNPFGQILTCSGHNNSTRQHFFRFTTNAMAASSGLGVSGSETSILIDKALEHNDALNVRLIYLIYRVNQPFYYSMTSYMVSRHWSTFFKHSKKYSVFLL